jgi:hypothetical protein
MSTLTKDPDGFNFDTHGQNFPSQANNKYRNSAVLGPSVMVNLVPTSHRFSNEWIREHQ